MSAAHHTAEYRRNAPIVRARVKRAWAEGRAVWCVGCGREVAPGAAFQVGHIIDASRGGANTLDNLGPQHKRENLSRGGRLGAAVTNTRSRASRGLPTW